MPRWKRIIIDLIILMGLVFIVYGFYRAGFVEGFQSGVMTSHRTLSQTNPSRVDQTAKQFDMYWDKEKGCYRYEAWRR